MRRILLRLILVFIVLFLSADLVFLNWKVLEKKKQNEAVSSAVIPRETEKQKVSECSSSCLSQIYEATASLKLPTPVPQKTEKTAPSSVKEFYIPLGSGSTTSKDWVELTGVESVVDMDNYPGVKLVIFEASMRIPTANGRVYAKLYNVTDKHDVWYSEVYAEGSSGYRAESGNIILSPGRKLYRVMMKSTMGYEAILDSARIKILLK